MNAISSIALVLAVGAVAPSRADSCDSKRAAMTELLRDYELTAKNSSRFSAPYDRISSRLRAFTAEAKKDDVCGKDLLQEYAYQSVKMVYGFDGKSRALSLRDGTVRASEPRAEFDRYVIADLIRFLQRKGKLHAFDESDRKSWGGEWSIPRGQAKAVLGAYDCEEGKIYFDSTLLPLDLGALLVHELDHLVRDRMVYGVRANELSEMFSAHELVVIDEYIASFLASAVQAQNFVNSNRDFAPTGLRAALDPQSDGWRELAYWSMDIPGERDFNFFARDGRFIQIWKELFKSPETSPALSEEFSAFVNRFLRNPKTKPHRMLLGQIFGLIHSTYFSEPMNPDVLTRIARYDAGAKSTSIGLSEEDQNAYRLSPLSAMFQEKGREFIDWDRWIDFSRPTSTCRQLRSDGGVQAFGKEGSRPGKSVRACLFSSERL